MRVEPDATGVSAVSTMTLAGGTYQILGTLQFNGADIRTNSAILQLDGPDSAIVNQFGSDALLNFTTNTPAGSFTLLNGRSFTAMGPFSNAGPITIGPGSSITTLAAFTNTGTFTVQAGGFLNLAGQSIFSSGTFTGAGSVSITGMLTWIGGEMSGSGSTTIQNGGTLTLNNSSHVTIKENRTLINDGLIVWSGNGSIELDGAAQINNLADGQFNIQGDGMMVSNGGAPMFTNDGTLDKIGGTGTTSFASGILFSNSGILEVDSGTLLVAGLFLPFNSTTSTLTGGTYQLHGTLQFTGADIRTNAAVLVLDGPDSAIVNQFGSDALANLGAITAAGSFTLQNGRSFTTSGNFNNAGTLTVGVNSSFTATGGFSQSGTANVLSGGTLTLAGGGDNTGIFILDANTTVAFTAGTFTLSAVTTLEAAGLFRVAGATLSINSS